jgi:biopolymer transport protein ExbB/TolQ
MAQIKPMGLSSRAFSVLIGFLVGILAIVLASNFIASDGMANFLLDRARPSYPFTIQNLMWLIFFTALGELWMHFKRANAEARQIEMGLLPEEQDIMLRSEDLGEIFKRLRGTGASDDFFLQRLATRTILQFQSSRSVDQSNSILNSSLELYQHEVDLRYNIIRYVIWLIPTLGFIGTVIGIALALGDAGAMDFGNPTAGMLAGVTDKLGIAFYTTLIALIQSAVLVLLQQVAQAKEEMALNKSGQYCLDNLINRLFEK